MPQQGIVYIEEGRPVYRAYSIGECIVSLVAARMGEAAFPNRPQFQAFLERSAGMEETAIQRFKELTGGTVIWQQKELELPIGGDSLPMAVLRGHIDGLWAENDTILEVKALGARNFAAWNSGGLVGLDKKLALKYTWQAAAYGHMAERNVAFVILNKDAVESDYESFSDIIVEPARHPDTLVPKGQLIARIVEIEDWASRDEYPDCDRGCRPGDPYDHVHMFESFQMGGDELGKLLALHHELGQRIGTRKTKSKPGTGLMGEREEVTDEIKAKYGPGKHAAGYFTAVIEDVPTGSFDSRKLKKDYPEIYEMYWKPRVDTRLTVRYHGNEEAGSDGTGASSSID